MAVAISRIGIATFQSMDPRPPGFTYPKTFESRSGVPGYNMWHGVKRGSSFQVRTVADTYNLHSATILWEVYRHIQAVGNAVPIAWEGEVLPYRVMVSSVQHDIRSILHGQGGLTWPRPAYAMIHATWDLVVWESGK